MKKTDKSTGKWAKDMNRYFTFPEEETLMANKYTKICSPSLWIREMQTEIKVSFYTHKIGKTQRGWRCGATGIHMLLVGVSTGTITQETIGYHLMKPNMSETHDLALSLLEKLLPCVPGATSLAMWPWVSHFIFLCPCFLICKMRIVLPTHRVVVRIHIHKSTEKSAWPIVSSL